MSNCLAIVIPAYKDIYLRKTLESLVRQTCRDFVVYIGDDASPYGLKTIVDEFKGILDLRYTRFNENLGGGNLVAQWQRCVDLVSEEEWICLFSDDDIMEPRCVERFHDVEIPDNIDLLHYDLKIIDESDAVIRESPSFSPLMSIRDFYFKLFKRQIDARMPEFIFKRSSLNFVGFDLAWRSDTATVMQAAQAGGIYTISSGEDDCVRWRASGNNISGDRQLISRKNESNIDFFCWVKSFFEKNGIRNPFSRLYQLKTIIFALEYHDWRDFIVTGIRFAGRYTEGCGFVTLLVVCPLLLYRLIYRQFELRRIS